MEIRNTPETVTVSDEVTFDITVINQCHVAADRIAVIDYLPAQLELADDDWALARLRGGNNSPTS